MKLKNFVIPGLILMLIGLIACVIGYANEGFNQTFDDLKAEVSSETYSLEEVTKISFDSAVDELEIISTTGNEIKVTTSVKGGFYYDINVVGKVLNIEQGSNSLFSNGSCEVVIQIPSSATIDLEINIDTGEVDIENIKSNNINVTVDVGNVEITSVDFVNLNVETDVGNIDLNLIGSSSDYSINGKGIGLKTITANTDIGEVDIEYND
jgi:hypothetical protein